MSQSQLMKFSEIVSLPTIVVIASDACNLKCKYCSIAKPPSFAEENDFLQNEYFLKFIRQIQPSHLYISGGEPTIHPGLIRFGETAVKYGHKISLETNGLLSLNKLDDIINSWGANNICSIRMTPHLGQTSFEFIFERAKHLKNKNIPQVVKFIGIPGILPELRNHMNKLIDCEIGTCITPLFGKWNDKYYPRDYTLQEYYFLLNLVTSYTHGIQFFGGIKSIGMKCRAGYDYIVINQNGNNEITRCGNDSNTIVDLSQTVYNFSKLNCKPCRSDICSCDSHFIYNVNLTLDEKKEFDNILAGSSKFIGTENIIKYLSDYLCKNDLNFVHQANYLKVKTYTNMINNKNTTILMNSPTEVDDYWGEHTVNSLPFSSADESLEYLEYRFNEYPLFREFMELYGNHDGEVILDYGCGPGNDVVGFLAHTNARKVIGIDVSEKALSLAQHRLSLHNFDKERFQLIQVSNTLPEIPLPDCSIDYIYCEGVLHHTSDPLSILKEFHRILKPDGTICIMVYNRNSIWFHLYTAYCKMILEKKFSGLSVEEAFQKNTDGESCPIARCYRPDEFSALATEAGFTSNYRGGYLSKTELNLFKQYRNAAINSTQLPMSHREFISSIETGSDGFPLFEGKHAGIGGVHTLKKADGYKSDATHSTVSTLAEKNRSAVMLVGDSKIDRRVLDEARTLINDGWHVTVIAGPKPLDGSCNDESCYPDVDIVRITEDHQASLHSCSTFFSEIDFARFMEINCNPFNVDFQMCFHQSDEFLREAILRPAAVYVAHDLPQLAAAAYAASYHKSFLVYDAHELYPEQTFNVLNAQALYSSVESLLVPFADRVITVNESIAGELSRRYSVKSPVVILNCPSTDDAVSSLSAKGLLRQDCGIPDHMRILLFQGGLVKKQRNLEALVAAMGLIQSQDVALVLMGPVHDQFKADLERIALSHNTLNRTVFFHDSVPQNALLRYTASADAGIIPYPAIDLNTYYCTPNKLYEFIAAGLPILANDLPELNKFVSGQGIGMNMMLGSPIQIADAIDAFFTSDLEKYRQTSAAISFQYTWKYQEDNLLKLYNGLEEVTSLQKLIEFGKIADLAHAREVYLQCLSNNPSNIHVLLQLQSIEVALNNKVKAEYYSNLILQTQNHMDEVAQACGKQLDVSCMHPAKHYRNGKLNILVLLHYPTQNPPMRATIRDHIFCFERYSEHNVFYLNLWYCDDVPAEILSMSYDLIILHTVFLSARWDPAIFSRLMGLPGLQKLCKGDAIKIAIPQDEFLHTDVLCDFINSFNVQHVFTVAPETEWPAIYRKVDYSKVTFHKVLTGYLDDTTVTQILEFSAMITSRNVDIGYRAWRAAYWLGRHGQLKYQIADIFKVMAPRYGFTTDISTDDRQTILENDWYKFMLNCKYFIGVEGGASILDRDGSIKACTENYLTEYPSASFEEVESVCFPQIDGSFRLFAISPRNLEACATKTCQVLVEGSYNGILQPWVHYIPLNKDFSNLGEVFYAMKDDDLRTRIVEKAYQDIVASEKYSYRNFVSTLLMNVLPHK